MSANGKPQTANAAIQTENLTRVYHWKARISAR